MRKRKDDDKPWLNMSPKEFKVFQKAYWERLDGLFPAGTRVRLKEKFFGYKQGLEGSIVHELYKDRISGKESLSRVVVLEDGPRFLLDDKSAEVLERFDVVDGNK